MIVYLASPANQLQADVAREMPVLLSFACYDAWLDKWQQSFGRILIDSGAYSEFATGKPIDLSRYADWSQRWKATADAIAGLDSIAGDWRTSWRNYQSFEDGFPTFHDTDPEGFLADLVSLAQQRGHWLAIGLKPPREGKEKWLRKTLDRIPDGVHVHGWALRRYTHLRRIDSVDSTNWFRDALDLRGVGQLAHLTMGELLEIVVKRYQRWTRTIRDAKPSPSLFPDEPAAAN